jgi:hypothetical protein
MKQCIYCAPKVKLQLLSEEVERGTAQLAKQKLATRTDIMHKNIQQTKF